MDAGCQAAGGRVPASMSGAAAPLLHRASQPIPGRGSLLRVENWAKPKTKSKDKREAEPLVVVAKNRPYYCAKRRVVLSTCRGVVALSWLR